jgi:hypothetical protein
MNVAINLARDSKMYPLSLARLIAIRDIMGKEKLDKKRNQAVRRVHADSNVPHHVHLTMPRWPAAKGFQNLSILDPHKAG